MFFPQMLCYIFLTEILGLYSKKKGVEKTVVLLLKETL